MTETTWLDWADHHYLAWMRGVTPHRIVGPGGPLAHWHTEVHALCYAECAARLFGREIVDVPAAKLEVHGEGWLGWTDAHHAAAVPARYWLKHGDNRALRKFLKETRPDGDVWWGWNDTDRLAHSAHHLWLYRILGIKLNRRVVEMTLDLQTDGGWRGSVLPAWIDLDAVSILRTAKLQGVAQPHAAKGLSSTKTSEESASSTHEQVALDAIRLELSEYESPLDVVPWI